MAMQTLSTSRQGAVATKPGFAAAQGPDHAVWLPASAFAVTAGVLALGQVSLAGTLGLAAAASAGSVLFALARAADRLRAPLLPDRLVQGALCAALLWAAQLLAAGTLPAGTGLVAAGSVVLALFMTLSAAEAVAAGTLCLAARRGLSGCIAAAVLVDNRAFSSLGALRR
jgi:hypothetical protein